METSELDDVGFEGLDPRVSEPELSVRRLSFGFDERLKRPDDRFEIAALGIVTASPYSDERRYQRGGCED